MSTRNRTACQQLVHQMVAFLRSEVAEAAIDSDSAESVEVAIQCLETAYSVPLEDAPEADLYDIFTQASGASVATEEDKKEAEAFKTQGNDFLRENKFTEALQCYDKAIAKDGRNPVYFSNRAAARSKLGEHDAAIRDCQQALAIDGSYAKAYGRMGLAHSELGQFAAAQECYQAAVALEPSNEGYATNLNIAAERAAAAPAAAASATSTAANPFASLMGAGGGLAGLAGLGGSGGTPDLAALMSNPALMDACSSLMQNPQMQSMLSGIMSSVGGAPASTPAPEQPSAAPTPPDASAPVPDGIAGLMNAGRQLAEQMQSQHPELLESLRSQFGGAQPPNTPQPPPQP